MKIQTLQDKKTTKRAVTAMHKVQDASHQRWNAVLHDVARQSAAALDNPNATLESVFATWIHREFTSQHRWMIEKHVFTKKRSAEQQIIHMFGANGLLSGIPFIAVNSETARDVYGGGNVYAGIFTTPKHTGNPEVFRVLPKEGTPTGLFVAVFLQYLIEQNSQFLETLEALLNDTMLPDDVVGTVTSVPNEFRAVIVNQAFQNATYELLEQWFSGDTVPSATDWNTITAQFEQRVEHHSAVVADEIQKTLS